MVDIFPTDLDDLIKTFLTKHKEEWDEDKHFIYIDCTHHPPILFIEEWNYKIPKPTLGELYVLKLPESAVKTRT